MPQKDSAEKAVRDIRRKTRRKFSAEEKMRIVLEGLRGEESIASKARHGAVCPYSGQLNGMPLIGHCRKGSFFFLLTSSPLRMRIIGHCRKPSLFSS